MRAHWQRKQVTQTRSKQVPTNKNTASTTTKQAPATLFTVSPAYSTEQGARMGAPAGAGNAGYVVRWPNKGADVLMRTPTAKGDGPLWRVRCNAHGQVVDVPDDDRGSKRQLESAAGRREWCAGCKADAAAKQAPKQTPAAPKQAAAKSSTRKTSTSKVAK
jgi:hypothetical protein